ncbi:MAG: M56 family metallopeptidase [Acidobacteriota bacterium]
MPDLWDATLARVLLDVLLRPTVLAVVVGLILLVARVRDGALSNAAWRLVLVVMLATPVLPSVVPAIAVPIPGPAPSLPWPAELFEAQSDSGQRPASPQAALWTGPLASAAAPHPTTSERTARDVDWRRAALLVYVFGVLFLGLRLWVGWRGAGQVLKTSAPIDPRVGRTRVAPVRESSRVATPVTLGVLAPVIILPSEWRTWPTDTLHAALAHEEAHVRRRDTLVGLAARLNRAIFWFHPVAWWLERRLTITAEHACDDAVIGVAVPSRSYAALLVEMAAAVRLHGGRLRRLEAGMHGASLRRRVGRLLAGRSTRASNGARALVGTVCVVAAAVAISCQRQATDLKPDPDVTARLAAQAEATARYEAAKRLSDAEVEALEARVAANPEDLDSRDTLLTYYRWGGRPWKDMHARFRQHALWLIEHHPENPLVAEHGISSRSDPTGDAAARPLWLAHIANPDANPAVLSNAAYYFQATDKALAAELLLRGKAVDPDGPPPPESPLVAHLTWSYRLGMLYARAIAEHREDGRVVESPFGSEARRRLAETTDLTLLMAAASWLMSGATDLAVAARCAERALELTPDDVRARVLLTTIRMRERRRTEEWTRMPTETLYEKLPTLSEADRIKALPRLAEGDYMHAEYKAWTKQDPDEVARLYARSKAHAEQLLELLGRHSDHPDYGTILYRARVARGLHAQREGDRRTAVRFLLDAAAVQTTEELAYTYYPAALEGRLVNWLLKDGERESVATFLERTAAFMLADKERRLMDAAAIRRGVMPRNFQYATSREASEAVKRRTTARQ